MAYTDLNTQHLPVYGVHVCPGYQESSCYFRMPLNNSPMQGCSSLLQAKDQSQTRQGVSYEADSEWQDERKSESDGPMVESCHNMLF
jgi:hypothetical protein